MIYLTVIVELEKQIQASIDILKRGGVVAFPTDTVYGMGANVFNERAVEKVYKVKQRPKSLPLPVLLLNITQLTIVVNVISPLMLCLARKFWPGGLTIIEHKASDIPDIITAGGDTVAVRIPHHRIPMDLISGLGTPIVGTSANISGEPSALDGKEVRRQIGDHVDFVIDDGVRCSGGVESTVIDITTGAVEILREGVISAKEIMEACVSISEEKQ